MTPTHDPGPPDNNAPEDGDKRFAPAAARNEAPIAAVLEQHLPKSGRLLEIASGTGQHACAFAARFPGIIWQPSDIDPARLASIRARIAEADCPNLLPPVELDAAVPGWAGRIGPFDAILIVNLLHLIGTGPANTVIDEAAHALVPGGRLAIYGPFLRDGRFASEGDERFHASLREQDPATGYKEVADIRARLAHAGLETIAREEMPANNLMLVAARQRPG